MSTFVAPLTYSRQELGRNRIRPISLLLFTLYTASAIMALQYLMDGGHRIALNLGSGIGSSLRDVLSTVERVSGRTLEIRYGPRRAGDPEVLLADTSLAKQTLGWTALLSQPETIVNTARRWSRSMRAQAVTS